MSEIVRKPLLSATLEGRTVTKVDVREIVFQPGQQTGRHLHACPVVGYIADGTALLQIEDGVEQRLNTGDAFHEPAETVIARFDNASETASLKFIAYYLLSGEEDLIQMLPDKK